LTLGERPFSLKFFCDGPRLFRTEGSKVFWESEAQQKGWGSLQESENIEDGPRGRGKGFSHARRTPMVRRRVIFPEEKKDQ